MERSCLSRCTIHRRPLLEHWPLLEHCPACGELVEPGQSTSLLTIAGLNIDAEKLLVVPVLVLTPNGLPPKFRNEVLNGRSPYEASGARRRLFGTHRGSDRPSGHSALFSPTPQTHLAQSPALPPTCHREGPAHCLLHCHPAQFPDQPARRMRWRGAKRSLKYFSSQRFAFCTCLEILTNLLAAAGHYPVRPNIVHGTGLSPLLDFSAAFLRKLAHCF